MSPKKSGFTLIELLISIAVIGVLVAMVLVSLSTARAKANISRYKTEVRSVYNNVVMDCQDDVYDADILTEGMLGDIEFVELPTCREGGQLISATVYSPSIHQDTECYGYFTHDRITFGSEC